MGDGCIVTREDEVRQAEIQMAAYRKLQLCDNVKVRVNFSDVLTEEEK